MRPIRTAVLSVLREPLAHGYLAALAGVVVAPLWTFAMADTPASWAFLTVLFTVLMFFALVAYVGDNRRASTESPYGSTVLIWVFVGPLWLYLLGLARSGYLWALPPLVLATVLLGPWATVRWLLIPLAAPRLAGLVARLSTVRLRQDRRGGASLAAAWAMLHGSPAKARLQWLEQKLNEAGDLRGAGITAHGLLWALRGDDERARLTLRGVLECDPLAVPALAEQVATGWLAADAAERGDWPQVRTLGYRPTGPRLASTRFLGAVAARLCGDAAAARALGQDPQGPSDARLRWCWLLSSRRRALWPLLQRALQTPRQTPPSSPSQPTPGIQGASGTPALPGIQGASGTPALPGIPAPPGTPMTPALPVPPLELGGPATPLLAALSLYARALRRYPLFLGDSDLQALALAWDQVATSPELRHQTLRRGVILGVDGEAALARLYRGLESDLATLARQARVTLDEAALRLDQAPSPLLVASARQLRAVLLGELEETAGRLRQRVEAGRALPIVEECREWETLRAQYEQAVRLGGPRLRREIWPTYFRALCKQEVWLFNERKAKVLSNTISRYLLAQAIELEDPERIELQRKNVACGW